MAAAIQEFDLQRAFCIFLDGNPDSKTGTPRTDPGLAPNVVYFAVPNGGTRSSAFEGMRLKQSGLKAGVHDLLFLSAGRLYGMEWKKPGGSLSAAQRDMHLRLLAAGMTSSITVDNLADAREWAFNHLLTIRK